MKKLISVLLSLILACCMLTASVIAENAVDSEKTLRYGDSGEDVKALQQRLTELEYYKGRISGNYLEGTQNAVRKFQADYGLEKTGEADPQTLSLLFSDNPKPEVTTASTDSDRFVPADAEMKEPQGITFQHIPWDSTPEEALQILIDAGLVNNSKLLKNKVNKLKKDRFSALKESYFCYGNNKKEPYMYKEKTKDKVLSGKLKELTIDGSGILKTIGKRTVNSLSLYFSVTSDTLQLVDLRIYFNKAEEGQDTDSLLNILKSSYGDPTFIKENKNKGTHYFWYGEYNTVVALQEYSYPITKKGKVVGYENRSAVYFASIDGLILSDSAEIPAEEEPTATPGSQIDRDDTGF